MAGVGEALAIDDLIAMIILSRTEFNDVLQSVLEELKERGSVSSNGSNRIKYHDFIYDAETFEKSVKKAYVTSYLVNEGKAEIVINPLEEEVFISHIPGNANANANTNHAQTETESRSIAISLSYDEWLRWRQKRNRGNGKRNGQNEG